VFHLIRFGTYFVFELRSIILNGASALPPKFQFPSAGGQSGAPKPLTSRKPSSPNLLFEQQAAQKYPKLERPSQPSLPAILALPGEGADASTAAALG